MRLREPFQGYKLSSGHPLYHIAFLVGGIFAFKYTIPRSKHNQNISTTDSDQIFKKL
jgi:hypothetical protein